MTSYSALSVFWLQVRDDTHKPLAGIQVGDVGLKIGDNGNDTGWMRLSGGEKKEKKALAQPC